MLYLGLDVKGWVYGFCFIFLPINGSFLSLLHCIMELLFKAKFPLNVLVERGKEGGKRNSACILNENLLFPREIEFLEINMSLRLKRLNEIFNDNKLVTLFLVQTCLFVCLFV